MHTHTLENWKHGHDFAVIHEHGERRTEQVLFLTLITMVIEITAGVIWGSMALLADGWHMSTHAVAFMITIFAYRYARKHAKDIRFTFGTGKISILGGFASAISLAVVALMMAIESIQRLIYPQVIHFNEAIGVAILGLIVNLISALLLQSHSHSHEHNHHNDHNLKAAYLHVLADALTSVLAIIALVSGKFMGWNWLDPMMGIIGAVVITRWSYGLLRETGPTLLDQNFDEKLVAKIKERIESDSDNRVSDLHIWKVSPNHYAVIIALVTHFPKPVDYYKKFLIDFVDFKHITIEVHHCTSEPCLLR